MYVGIFALALAIRLAGLDGHPLNDAEAREALTAWRFSQGLIQAGLPASPIYLTLTSLGFAVFGNLAFVVRLAPALFGAALTLLPWLVRDGLGRGRAVLTSALLGVSSVGLLASRSADGTTLAVFFVLLTAAAVWRSLNAPDSVGWMVGAGAAFGVSLASGPEALLGLIALLIALPLTPGAWGAVVDAVRERARVLVVAAVAGFILAATFFLLNRDGLGAAAASWLIFAQRFNPTDAGRSLTALIAILFVYEPLILIGGLLSVTQAFVRGGVDRLLTMAALLVLALVVTAAGRSQFDLVWLTVLLAPLAAAVIESLIVDFDWRQGWGIPVAFGAITLALAATSAINLTQFGELLRSDPGQIDVAVNWFQLPWFRLGQAIAATVLIPVAFVLFGLGWSFRSAQSGLTASLGMLLLAATLAGGWGATHTQPGSPAELWWPHPVGADLARLRETLLWSGEQSIGEGTEIDVVAQATSDGALAWALRDFKKVKYVTSLSPDVAAAAVIAPAAAEDAAPPQLGAAYVGAPFQLDPVWFPDTLFWNEQLDWLLFRRANIQYPTLTVLWLRQDIQAPPAVTR